MKKETIALIFVTIALIGSVASGAIILNEFYKANAPRTCEEFVSVGYIWLPERISNLFMNNRLVLHFSMVNGKNISVYGIVKDHGIYDLECKPRHTPDAEVWMSDEMALQLATSTKPITTFVTGWRTGKIVIKTYNRETEQKLAYADSLLANDYEPVPVAIRGLFQKYLYENN